MDQIFSIGFKSSRFPGKFILTSLKFSLILLSDTLLVWHATPSCITMLCPVFGKNCLSSTATLKMGRIWFLWWSPQRLSPEGQRKEQVFPSRNIPPETIIFRANLGLFMMKISVGPLVLAVWHRMELYRWLIGE